MGSVGIVLVVCCDVLHQFFSNCYCIRSHLTSDECDEDVDVGWHPVPLFCWWYILGASII